MASPYKTDLVFREHRGDLYRRSCLVDLGLEFVSEDVGRPTRTANLAYEKISPVSMSVRAAARSGAHPVVPESPSGAVGNSRVANLRASRSEDRQMSLSGPSRQ
jgi:hypothetical protein